MVNADKTEVMYQLYETAGSRDYLKIHLIRQHTIFKLLQCSMDAEINSRINKASAAFSRIRKTFLFSHNLRLLPMVAVYKAIWRSVLLYGCETLTLYRKHVYVLKSFHTHCIKAILSLKWRGRYFKDIC